MGNQTTYYLSCITCFLHVPPEYWGNTGMSSESRHPEGSLLYATHSLWAFFSNWLAEVSKLHIPSPLVFLNRSSRLQVKKSILSHPPGQSLSPSNLDISTWVYSIPLCHTGSVRSRQDDNVEWADYVSKLLIMWALAYSSVTKEYCPALLPCLPWRLFLPILSSY